MADEFDIIGEYFAPLSIGAPGALGLEDDAAVLSLPDGSEFVVTTDTVVQGVHFLDDEILPNIAAKLIGSNLSDLAAMGARPHGFTLNCAWPKTLDVSDIATFATALGTWVEDYAFPLCGGDTVRTSGPGVYTITAFGLVPAGKALRRNGAKPGDGVFVSGTIGDAALGLLCARGEGSVKGDDAAFLDDRYRRPQPRTDLGQRLNGHANACIDISDGLVQDLGHIARTSSVDIVIEAGRIPLSEAARAYLHVDPDSFRYILTGGDDYELAFTMPLDAPLRADACVPPTPITQIGTVQAGPGTVKVRDESGALIDIGSAGYNHFGQD